MLSPSVHDQIQRRRTKQRPPRTSTNKDTSGVPSTNEDVASKPRWVTRGDIKLQGHFGFLHEGPWLRINLKVRKSSSMTLS